MAFSRSVCTVALGLTTLTTLACHRAADVPCAGDLDCDLAASGLCVASSSGRAWCAYPDGACTSGYRYSDLDVGDGLAAACTEAFALRVALGGGGTGEIATAQGPLACAGGVCERSFPPGARVSLTATASEGIFLGWSDGCSGQGTCDVVMDRDRSVGALFGMPGQSLWVRQVGGTGNDQGAKLAVDGAGDVLATGIFSGTITVGGTTITAAGGTDVYVAKLAPADG
ncbi:MAG: hypothetical protein KIT31_42520, partial [Deltaproteobacteria bacterium]|nr:hypothetical protein [Deltaproteobacteria bacterium]